MMKSSRLFRNLIIVIILAMNIGCDQVSKTLVRNTIGMDQKFHYFDDHVMLTRVENTGAFLSLGNSLSAQIKFIILIAVPVVALLIAIYYLFTRTTISRLSLVGICCIVGGGLGNIYDRYLYGSVTDFMHVDFIVFRTGIFNMADVSIMVGALTLVTSTILGNSLMDLNADSDKS